MSSVCPICKTDPISLSDYCDECSGLLRWVRSYFAEIPGLPEKITPSTRFLDDLDVNSLDYMDWPLEAEEKLSISLSADEALKRMRTIGDWILLLRQAGASWPSNKQVRLLPRKHWWSNYEWSVDDKQTVE
jgi:acyl carrier protein